MNYYAYVVVTKNEFKYTTNDKKVELVLYVEGHNGVVTTLPDLGNAIDVTEFSGVITLADNLYRIIGVFGDNNHGIKDQQLVKVIKNTSYGKLAWNTTKSNDWASASLNNATKTHTAKIGLMYPSDYGYATTPDYWTTGLNEYYHAIAYSKDWLFLGSDEWLLSLHSSDFHDAWFVISSGNVTKGYGVIATCAVRSPFYP